MKSVFISILILFLLSCTGTQPPASVTRFADGYYDSEYPQKPVSSYLKKISSTVRLITSLTFYREYYFRFEDTVSISQIHTNPEITRQADNTIIEKPASGTAMLVSIKNNKALLLTCAHTIYEPDTLINFYQNDQSSSTNRIRSLSIKIRQSKHVVGLPGSGRLTILANDSTLDLALVQQNIPVNLFPPLTVFTYPLGKSAELNWGSFVYLFGFPHGKKIVSNAIVSHPNRNTEHDFIINATMYQGVSGGPILALRDGPPHLELVGIANALPIIQHLVVRPDPNLEITPSTFGQPYSGSLFIERQNEIIQGMTFALSAEKIRLFFTKYESLLKANDIKLSDFPFLSKSTPTHE